MESFVKENSVVREIWGKGDTILFIFAGASAEFALNKAVDWLYFTGKLPADPIGRLFSTVDYARQIVFSDKEYALQAINRINAIHLGLEMSRGETIPDWAYRDVLFMLIDYSIRSFELLERKLSKAEKTEVLEVFNQLGSYMKLKELPANYPQWLQMRQNHLNRNLAKSRFTIDLYKQYKKHLGSMRYMLLLQVQSALVPPKVSRLLGLGKLSVLPVLLPVYKISRKFKADWILKSLILPPEYKLQIKALDRPPVY